jgi:dimeric dUTPase (all-alpha-NTP-PPase superfamily)
LSFTEEQKDRITVIHLLNMQKELDTKICDKFKIKLEDTTAKRTMALLVELAELANEWRGFKFWSEDKGLRWEKALEEYVDCLHFTLSLCYELNFEEREIYEATHVYYTDSNDLELMFSTMFFNVSNFLMTTYMEMDLKEKVDAKIIYRTYLYVFLQLYEKLGFDWKEVAAAYIKKNKVNHERQENGY